MSRRLVFTTISYVNRFGCVADGHTLTETGQWPDPPEVLLPLQRGFFYGAEEMEYGIKSIPTKFMGVQFRSRLEAKWGAFFHLMGWNWQYEPRDFNGWIPDFALYGGETHIYVEVKPVTEFHQETWAEMQQSGCRDALLLVGECCPLPEIGMNNMPQIGWLHTPWGGRDTCDFGYWKSDVGLTACEGSWHNLLSKTRMNLESTTTVSHSVTRQHQG